MRLHLRVAEDGYLELVTALGERIDGLVSIEMAYPNWAQDDPDDRGKPHVAVKLHIQADDAVLNAEHAQTREMAAVKPLRSVPEAPTEETAQEHPTLP